MRNLKKNKCIWGISILCPKVLTDLKLCLYIDSLISYILVCQYNYVALLKDWLKRSCLFLLSHVNTNDVLDYVYTNLFYKYP